MGTALEQAAQDWIAQLAVLGRSTRTVELRERRLSGVVNFLHQRGCLRPADVNATDLDAYMLERQSQGLARESLRSFRTTIRGFFDWLHERGKILRNPANDLDLGTRNEQPLLLAPLSESDVTALLDAIPMHTAPDLRNRCFVELLYGCGLRLNEALTLRLADVQLDTGVLTVHGKGGLDAQVPLLPSAVAVLRDYLAVRRELVCGPDGGTLFLSRDGKPMVAVSVQQWVKRLGKQVLGESRRVHPHLFRHSIAVHLLRRGLDIRYIQCFLRHADMDTTKQYLRLVPEHLREDYDRAMPHLAPDCSAS